MSVTILGNYPSLNRVRTGLFSVDLALANRGELGLPLRTITEIYGYPNVGKSTLSYYLASKAAVGANISICDLEFLDRDYLSGTLESYGYHGSVHLVDLIDEKKKPFPHEKMLMDMNKDLYDETYGAAILDSVGAIQPIAEAEGDLGEAFMGKRAKLVAQTARAMSNALRNKERPSAAFVVNHVHSIIGGRGHNTAGGDTLKFMAAQRIMLWTAEVFQKEGEAPYGFLVKGQLEKLRYGGRGKTFQFYIVPGYGVHPGVSALFDCVELGIAERKAMIKMNGKNVGYLQADFLSFAADGSIGKKFDVFEAALVEYEGNLGRAQPAKETGEKEEENDDSEAKPVKSRGRKRVESAKGR